VKGTRRTLLSVREQNNGRLIVTVQGAGNKKRDLGIPSEQPGASPEHNVRISHQKFSVHPSTLSGENNQLHFHQILENGTKRDDYHVTNAIKSGRYALLFTKRYSDLRDSIYDLKKATNIRDLGVYDSECFTLGFGEYTNKVAKILKNRMRRTGKITK
jgi:hypothetical protein